MQERGDGTEGALVPVTFPGDRLTHPILSALRHPPPAAMMMRRAPQAAASAARRAVGKAAPAKADKKPVLDTFIANGDFTGAVALLEFQRRAGEEDPMTLPWLGYAAFHLGDYAKALKAYQARAGAGGRV